MIRPSGIENLNGRLDGFAGPEQTACDGRSQAVSTRVPRTQARSKRSSSITLVQAFTKSAVNFPAASSWA